MLHLLLAKALGSSGHSFRSCKINEKCIKNQPPPNSSPNRKNPPLERPRLHFSSIFDAIWPPIFHRISRPADPSQNSSGIERELCFTISGPPIFPSNVHQHFMFFLAPLLELFSFFYGFYVKINEK